MTEPTVEYREPTIEERIAAKAAKAARDRKKMRPWLISAMVIVALWALIASFAPPPPLDGSSGMMLGFMVGSAVGACLFMGLAVGFFLWLVAGRRLQPYDSARHVGLLVIVALIATAPMTLIKLSFTQRDSADVAVMQQFQTDLQTRVQQAKEEANVARTTFEQAQPMTPQALSQPGGFDRARRALNELDSAQTQLIERVQAYQQDTRRQVAESTVSASGKAAFEEGYQETLPSSERAAALSQENITNLRGQLEVLARRRWVNQGGMFAFTSEADLAEIKALTAREEQIARELQALQQQLQ